MRELHWHPNADEWQYYLSGQGRMTVFASGGKSRTFDYQAGDVGSVPFAMGHYVQNTGDETLTYLEMFRSDHFADVSLSQWMGVLPPELVKAHLNLDDDVIAGLGRGQRRYPHVPGAIKPHRNPSAHGHPVATTELRAPPPVRSGACQRRLRARCQLVPGATVAGSRSACRAGSVC